MLWHVSFNVVPTCCCTEIPQSFAVLRVLSRQIWIFSSLSGHFWGDPRQRSFCRRRHVLEILRGYWCQQNLPHQLRGVQDGFFLATCIDLHASGRHSRQSWHSRHRRQYMAIPHLQRQPPCRGIWRSCSSKRSSTWCCCLLFEHH